MASHNLVYLNRLTFDRRFIKYLNKKGLTFLNLSKAPLVSKVSFPCSSIVTAASLAKVTPEENGWPGLLQTTLNSVSKWKQRKRTSLIYKVGKLNEMSICMDTCMLSKRKKLT
jgi:hypothetical protein